MTHPVPGDRLVFIDDELDWDDPRHPEPAAPEPPRPAPPRPRRRQTRTLAGDLARLRARLRRPALLLPALDLLLVLATLAAGVAAVVVVTRALAGDERQRAAPSARIEQPPAVTSASVVATPPAPPAASTLRLGARGASVRDLQEALRVLALDARVPDGVFGPSTSAAVASFQVAHGLPADGVVGPATTRALGDALAQAAARDAATARRGLDEAVTAGRLSGGDAERFGAVVDRGLTELRRLPAGRGAPLVAVFHDVAAQESEYERPRATALFGTLDANARALARRSLPLHPGDVEDGDGVVYRFFPGHGFQFQPLANFARLNVHVTAGDRERAGPLADALLTRGIRDGDALVWEYSFPFNGPSRWTSGLAQAVAAQALARAAGLLRRPALLVSAKAAFRSIPEKLSRPLADGLWIREYGFSDIAILNAQLQSLVSLSDYLDRTDDTEGRAVVRRLDTATRALLPRFDTGCWSLYSLGGARASLHYHRYHVQLLGQLARRDGFWRETRDRWAGYLRNGC